MHFVNISFLNCGPDILRWDRGTVFNQMHGPAFTKMVKFFYCLDLDGGGGQKTMN
jgi:hypothetical protein